MKDQILTIPMRLLVIQQRVANAKPDHKGQGTTKQGADESKEGLWHWSGFGILHFTTPTLIHHTRSLLECH
jgi:hypothetical protein